MAPRKFQVSNLVITASTLESAARLGELVAQWWLAKLIQHPRITGGITTVFTVAMGGLIYFIPTPREKSPQMPQSYAEQIAALDATQASLDRLSTFIRTQREQVDADQRVLTDLRAQRKSLEPLVSADRRIVNALLREQEERAREAASRERWFGFGLGVVSSIVASALLALAGLLLKKLAMRRSRRPKAN